MSNKDFYIHLVPFDKDNTSYRCDFTVEVRNGDDSLYATFGGSFCENKEEFIKRVATNLNTIGASKISKVLQEPGIKKVSLPLKELKKALNTGIKYELVDLSNPKEKLKKEEGGKELEARKTRMKRLFSRFT